MKTKCLANTVPWISARILGGVPTIWAKRLLVGILFGVAATLMVGCYTPALTDEELQSDPMPPFEDSVISGRWLIDGKLETFETKQHGVYLLHPSSGDSNDDEVVFKLKRAGSLLIMEYVVRSPSGEPLYQPCWVGVNETTMELYCLQSDELAKLNIATEERKYGDETLPIVTESQERLKQFYAEQANNEKVFELTFKFTRPQPARVARLLKKAQHGNLDAQEMLARALMQGEIVEKDEEQAMKWARAAGEGGRASAQVLCGNLLMERRRLMPPTESVDALHEAHAWYLRAALQNYPEAFSQLGHVYETDVLADDSSAVNSYKRGVELGDAESFVQMGLRYWYGTGVPEDQHKAQLYLESVPPKQRSSSASFTLAAIYLYALDPDQRNDKKALVAAEAALASSPACETYALAAKAAFQSREIDKAVRYQESAICETRDDVDKQRAQLDSYRDALSNTSASR